VQTINQALEELRSLHQKLTHTPAPEIAPQAFLPFPPGADPVSFALEEVERLKQLIEAHSQEPRNTETISQAPAGSRWVPRASVFAGDNGVSFFVELAGVSKDDVTVTLANGELVVRGERKPANVEGPFRPVFVEQEFGAFERRFPVPVWGRPEDVTARCVNGVLEVCVARTQEPSSGEINVEID
jgi:HSP20 family protein